MTQAEKTTIEVRLRRVPMDQVERLRIYQGVEQRASGKRKSLEVLYVEAMEGFLDRAEGLTHG